ncbi:MAG: methyltransferase domain-containing protein [Bacteroidetes bacterium]|nr:methyltransferase domain-containing protein [Bacteroidota bacterium]
MKIKNSQAAYPILSVEKIYPNVGIYDAKNKKIDKATTNTLKRVLKILPKIKKSHKILELGSSSGQTAEYLEEKYGCTLNSMNIWEHDEESDTPKEDNQEAFNLFPLEYESYDMAFSLDVFKYVRNKESLFRRMGSVLKPGGRFTFTTLLKTKTAPEELSEKIFGNNFTKLETASSYRILASKADLEKVITKKMPDQLTTHYEMVLKEIEKASSKSLSAKGVKNKKEAIETIKNILDAAEAGHITWGILLFQKRNIQLY